MVTSVTQFSTVVCIVVSSLVLLHTGNFLLIYNRTRDFTSKERSQTPNKCVLVLKIVLFQKAN